MSKAAPKPSVDAVIAMSKYMNAEYPKFQRMRSMSKLNSAYGKADFKLTSKKGKRSVLRKGWISDR